MLRSGLIATKIGNSSYYHVDGKNTHVTVLKVDECIVAGIKTSDKDGYNAVQLASVDTEKDVSHINKPQRKIFSAINIKPKKIVKEFRVDNDNILEVGTKLDVSHFKVDQFVDASSISIGKGFAGVMKRHNFGGLRASHGVSISHRSHGSTGQNQDPGRVFKGKKMAGRMGNKKVTKQNLKVIDVDIENNLLMVKGSVPGKKNSIVYLKDSVKNQNENISS
jgi:large subunit ribosomal protein L3